MIVVRNGDGETQAAKIAVKTLSQISRARIFPLQYEAGDRDKEREEQKFNRQAQRRDRQVT